MLGVLKVFLCERTFHGKNLEEHLAATGIVVLLDDVDHAVPDDVGDVHADALTHESVTTLLVDNGTLLVHHVVIFEQVLTDTEVVLLNLLLCALDALRNHGALDTLAILEAELVHNSCYALACEQTHELVLKRHIDHGADGLRGGSHDALCR